MTDEQQLDWERRRAVPAGLAAFLAATLVAAGLAFQASTLREQPDGDIETLRAIERHSRDLLLSTLARALAVTLVCVALFYLFRVTVARRPAAPRFVIPLIVLAPPLVAAGSILNTLGLIDAASTFADAANQSGEAAEDALSSRSAVGLAVAFGGQVAFAVALIVGNVNGMRAGLLNAFVAIVGIAVGVLQIIPILAGAVEPVQIIWAVSIGLIFIGRWPGGRGPAWGEVREIPWPSVAQRRAAMQGRVEDGPDDMSAPEDVAATAPRPKKRKRRR